MSRRDPLSRPGMLGRVLSTLLSVAFLVLLILTVFSLDADPGGLTATVQDRLGESGVNHAPTAVLLNFRAYDTWLEVAVLLLAAWGALALREATWLPERPAARKAEPVLDWLVRMLIPVSLLVGLYLLWRGTEAPGGAFQAGAVIGGGFVLLRLTGYRSVGLLTAPWLRASLLLGFGGFLLIATVLFVAGWGFLEFPSSLAGLVILLIELLITLSVAVTFVALLIASRPGLAATQIEHEREQEREGR